MKYIDAKKLHSGDEVMNKYTGEILTVLQVSTDTTRREVYLYFYDGGCYLHRTVK